MWTEHGPKLTRLLPPPLKGRGASPSQVRRSLEKERGQLPSPSLQLEKE